MRYLSVCSGIEAVTVAWHGLGFEAAAFSEIEKFPRDVLQHHYHNTPLHGDFTTIGAEDYGAIDILVGGTPCQSFSTAGLRAGLSDKRGNLALEFLRLAKRKKPKYILWENVVGVLSSNGGKDFASFLGGLGECGYGFAFRVLDSQYFGVPQRRRRVFVVGCLGDWRSAAKVLFEPESLQGNLTPNRKKRQDTAEKVAKCLTKKGAGGQNYDPLTANFVISLGHTKSNGSGISSVNTAYTLESTNSCNQAICYGKVIDTTGFQGDRMVGDGDVWTTLNKSGSNNGGGAGTILHTNKAIRRLTPLECERLQGFPDFYTNISGSSDSARYSVLGNSMAVPVIRWLGERIKLINGL